MNEHDRIVQPGTVLFVHEFRGSTGGAERYLEILAAGISSRGINVAVLIFAGDVTAGRRFAETLAPHGAVELRNGRATPLPIWRAIHRLAPSLVHWNFVDPFAFRGASFLLLPSGRPSVITDHLPMIRAGRHYEMTRQLANHRVAAVIVVGSAGAAAAHEHWPSSSAHVTVVRNGVPQRGTAQPRTALAGRPAKLLFVGRLTDQKRPDHAVAVLEELLGRGVDATLTIVGDGERREALTMTAEALGVGDRVELTGFTNDVGVILTAHDVLVAPSRWEGLPFVPLEAMDAALPVVLSDIPPHRELVDPKASGVIVVASDEPSEWALAVERVLADLPTASAAARDRGSDFSVDKMVDGTLAVYRDALRMT